MSKTMSKKIAINAIHTKTGGGLVFLQNFIEEIGKVGSGNYHLFVTGTIAKKFAMPKNVKLVLVHPPKNMFLMHAWEQLFFALKLRFSGFKVVLCNANYVPLLAPNPMPIIHTNVAVGATEKRFSMRVYWWVLEVLTKLSVKRASKVFTVAKHIIPRYVEASSRYKVQVAYPAVANIPASTAAREMDTIMAVGDIYLQKDYITMIKAFEYIVAKNPSMRLWIIGREVDKAVAAELKAYIQEKDLKKSIIFSGYVPHEQLLQLLQRATLYLNTSTVECFNMPVLEALACGVPTVVFDHDFQQEVAGDGAVYVKFEGDDKQRAIALADAVNDLLEDTGRCAQIAARGKARAASFSWAKTTDVILEALGKV